MECTYSTKRKLGRPRAASSGATASRKGKQVGGTSVNTAKKARQAEASSVGDGICNAAAGSGEVSTTLARLSTDRPAFSISPATGLAGLAESRFLSCFLQHCAPM